MGFSAEERDLKKSDVVFVSPTGENPTPKGLYMLSNLDQTFPYPIEIVFAFKKNSNNTNNIDVAQVLKQSLGQVLQVYYPLVGGVYVSWDGKMVVDCGGGDGGVPFVEAFSDEEMAAAVGDNITLIDDRLKKFVYSNPTPYNTILDVPPFSVQRVRLRLWRMVPRHVEAVHPSCTQGLMASCKTLSIIWFDDLKLQYLPSPSEQVIEGLDRAVSAMKKGEIALLTIAPEYGFGSTESKHELATVPPNSTLHYEVEVVSFDKEKESWDMNVTEKIEAAGKKKEEGNALLKAGKYARASKRYDKAAKFIEHDTSFSEEEKKQSKALKVTCKLNNAACKLKLKDYKEAEKLCTKVLELESTNVKALYRRAQAYMQMADLDLAEVDIKKALEIDPENRDVKLEYKALKEKIKEHNKKDAKFYGNMFAKLNKLQPFETNNTATKEATEPMSIDSKA